MKYGTGEITIKLPVPHPKQKAFISSDAKRITIKAGRRGGKTHGVAQRAMNRFLSGNCRILYAAPTYEQTETFWGYVKEWSQPLVDAKIATRNETYRTLACPALKAQIKAKTAWDADTLRGDYADFLILEEFQMMHESAWNEVGAPMLLDNDGDAVFIFTPPSVRNITKSKAKDPRFCQKQFKKALEDTTGRWQAFHFTSHDNPHLSKMALAEIVNDMSSQAYRQEILAEDVEDNPNALWTRPLIESCQVDIIPKLTRIGIGVDPSVTDTESSDECGIVAGGVSDGKAYLTHDITRRCRVNVWAQEIANLYRELNADFVVAEVNQGGDLVEMAIHAVDPAIRVIKRNAHTDKLARADAVVAKYEQGKVFHAKGKLTALEDEMCFFDGTGKSPNRLDSAVWLIREFNLSVDFSGWERHYAKGMTNGSENSGPEPDLPQQIHSA